MNKEVNKPMSLAREELITTIVTAINECGLPLFVTESVMRDLTADISVMAKQQAAAEKAQYEEALRQTNSENNEELK